MTSTVNMANTSHDTNYTDYPVHRLFYSLSNTTSSYPNGYRDSQIQQVEIQEPGINFALLDLTWTSSQMQYPVNNQPLLRIEQLSPDSSLVCWTAARLLKSHQGPRSLIEDCQDQSLCT